MIRAGGSGLLGKRIWNSLKPIGKIYYSLLFILGIISVVFMMLIGTLIQTNNEYIKVISFISPIIIFLLFIISFNLRWFFI